MDKISWYDFLSLFKGNVSKKLALGLFITTISAFLQVLIPIIIGNMVNQINTSAITDLLIFFLLTFSLQGLGSWFLGFSSIDFLKKIRIRLYNHIIKLPLYDIKKTNIGEFSSLIIDDSGNLASIISYALPQLIIGGITLMGSLIMIFWINFKLTFLTIIMLASLSLILIPVGIKTEKNAIKTQVYLGEMSGNITQKLANIELVKSFLGEKEEEKFGKLIITNLSNKSLKNISLLSVTHPLISFLLMIILMFLVFAGTQSVASGTMDAGSLTTFILYILQLTQVINDLTASISDFAEAKGSAYKIKKVLSRPTENLISGQFKNITKGSIELRNVSFKYPDSPVLRNISLTIKPNTITAIVGPSGVGKSTILSLISKYYTDYKGDIFIDNQDLKIISKESIRSQISYVSQYHNMFSNRISENMSYGKNRNVTQEDIETILEKDFLSFIKKMPKGVDTVLGENGTGLSEGEKQRLSIARAIINRPKILLLDEVTSSLDYESEHLIIEMIKEISKQATVVMITHKLETIVHADVIYMINDKGEIEAAGKHEDLISNNILYKQYFKKI